MWSTILSVSIGVLFILGINSILRLRRTSLGAPMGQDLPINYSPVSKFLIGRQRILPFIFIRSTPIIIGTFAVVGILKESGKPFVCSLIVSMLTVFLANIGTLEEIFNKKTYLNIKIFHISLMLFYLAISIVLSLLSEWSSFSALLPDFESMVQNLWSALVVASIVAVFLEKTDLRVLRKERDAADYENNLAELIRNQDREIAEKFSPVIARVAERESIDKILIASILVYESLNRPRGIRQFERFVVRLTGRKLTVGIAQVKSNLPLTDEESIQKMGSLIHEWMLELGPVDIEDSLIRYRILSRYNSGKCYAEEVEKIYKILSDDARPGKNDLVGEGL